MASLRAERAPASSVATSPAARTALTALAVGALAFIALAGCSDPGGDPVAPPGADAGPVMDVSAADAAAPDVGAAVDGGGGGADGGGACGDGDCGALETCTGCPADCGPCGPTPGPGALVISEVCYDPAAVTDAAGEWFELHAPDPDTAYHLGACAVRLGPDGVETPLGDVTIAAGGWLVVARRATDNGGLAPDVVVDAGSLGNGGDTVAVLCGPPASRHVVDVVTYGVDGAWPTARGASLALSGDALSAAANDDAAAWCVATQPYGDGDLGTPGGPNPVCPPPAVCGDDVCADAESCDGCPADCGPCPGCGNGICEADESCEACPADCGACAGCGDGRCGDDETCSGCPTDCGACGPTPTPGDVVISEIHYDPAAVTDARGEWFELHNPGAVDLALDGCRIEIGVPEDAATRVLSGLVIPAGGWLVMARSAADNGGLPPDVPDYGGLSLRNGGDTIALTCGPDGAREEIDRVVYGVDEPWPSSSGAALSLSADALSAAGNDAPGAWCLATRAYGDGDLGTPGAPNPVCAAAGGCGDGDCGGDESCATCPDDCGACGPRPAGGDLVITEVMQNPAALSDADGEWLELFNPDETRTFDLGGCVLGDSGGAAYTIPAGAAIGPRVHLVFAASAAPGFAPDLVWTGSFSLANAADDVVLTCDGATVDVVAWDGGPLFPAPDGASMSLDPFFYWREPGADAVLYNDEGEAWCETPAGFTFESGDRGTPGAPNPDCPWP